MKHMQRNIPTIAFCLGLFLVTSCIYFAFATKFTFHPRWAYDYFNPLAQSLLHGKINLFSPTITYDLAFYQGKWYAPWGVLSALFLIPIQLVKHRFIPTIYETIFFASLNAVIVFLLLQRLKTDFFPNLTKKSIALFLLLFTFGTTQFYVGTLGGVWHVDQMVTSFFPTVGIYFIFKKNRTTKDYFFSALCCSLALLGKPNSVLLITLPFLFYCWDFFHKTKKLKYDFQTVAAFLGKTFLIFFVPLAIFTSLFFTYNFSRFSNIFEFGYSYIHEAPRLAQIRKQNGSFSLKNIPTNIRYMLFEIPTVSIKNGIQFHFNQQGNSIFFLSPALLAIFWAFPFKKRGKLIQIDLYPFALWATTIITLLPIVLLYSTGWVQFGYRYTLDVTVLFIILCVFGLQGKTNGIFAFAVFLSIVMYCVGIISFL